MNSAPKVDAHHFFEVLNAHVLNRSDENGSGVVYEDVHGPKRFFYRCQHRLHLSTIGYIALGREEVVSSRRKFVSHTLQVVLIARANSHPRALGGKLPGENEAEPPRAACDQNHLLTKVPESRLVENCFQQGATGYKSRPAQSLH